MKLTIVGQQARGQLFLRKVYTRSRMVQSLLFVGAFGERGSGGGHGRPRLISQERTARQSTWRRPRQHCAGGGDMSCSSLFSFKKDGSCAVIRPLPTTAMLLAFRSSQAERTGGRSSTDVISHQATITMVAGLDVQRWRSA